MPGGPDQAGWPSWADRSAGGGDPDQAGWPSWADRSASDGGPGTGYPVGSPGAPLPYGAPSPGSPYGEAPGGGYGAPGGINGGGPHPGSYGPGPYPPPGGPFAPPGQYGTPSGPYAPPGPYGAPYGYGGGPQGAYHPWAYPQPRPQRTPEERRRRLRTGLLIGGALLLVAGAGIGIGAWLAPSSPKTVATGLLSKAVSAGTGAGSFRYVEQSTDDGVRDDISGDAGPSSGRQVITEQGTSGLDQFDLRLVGGVVYFRGNRAAVIDQLGVTAPQATTYVDRWVSVRKGEKPYKTFADGITTASNLHQLPATFVPASSAATPGTTPPATRISGGLSAGKGHPAVGTAALVVTTASSLPQSFSGQAVADSGARLALSWRFSRWGEKVHLAAPSGAVRYASLGVGSGTGHH